MGMRWLKIATLALVLSLLHVAPMQAQPPSPIPFTGIDAVVIVDQSGSMGGSEYGQPGRIPADPLGLRFQATQALAGLLGDLRFYAMPNGTVRMAVISFGDPQLTTTLNWETLAPSPSASAVPSATTARELWERQLARLQELLSADYFGKRNLGYTDPEAAVILARDLFNRLPPLPSGERNIRLIVIITDGQPCLVDDLNCTDLQASHRLLRRIEAFARQNLPAPDHRLYALILENPLTGDMFWDEFREDWFAVVGEPNTPPRYAVVEDGTQMARALTNFLQDTLTEITSALTNASVDVSKGPVEIFVPPYLSALRFTVFKTTTVASGEVLLLTNPSGLVLRSIDPDVTVFGTTANIESWLIKQPPSGKWIVDVKPGANNQVQVDYTRISMLAEGEVTGGYVWQKLPVSPKLYYIDDNQQPLYDIRKDPNFPMTVKAYVLTPTGSNLEFDLADVSGTNLRYEGFFTPETAGVYTLNYKGGTQPLPGESLPYVPLDTRSAFASRVEVNVKPLTPTLRYEPFYSGRWLATDPMTLCVSFTDPNAPFTPIAGVNGLEVRALWRDTSTGNSETIVLNYDDADPSCAYRGAYVPQVGGTYELWMEANITGETNDVFARSRPEHVLTVDPLTLIRLEPIDGKLEVVSDYVSTMPFWAVMPFSVSAVARDNNGNVVDLGALVGTPANPDFSPVTATLYDAQNIDVTSGRSVVTFGNVFEIRDPSLPEGKYQAEFVGKPLNRQACRCDYATGGGVVKVAIDRATPFVVHLQRAAIAGIGALLMLLVYYLRNRDLLRRKNPLTGSLIVRLATQSSYSSDGYAYETLATLPLHNGYNERTFSAKQLGLQEHMPRLKHVTISNQSSGSDNPEDAAIRYRAEFKGRARPVTGTIAFSEDVVFYTGDDGNEYQFVYES
jgi:hypothetical protein